jgi:hypothetical protein|tara:strand:+ start:79 stop:573 length:495 start_codon:yes stop_codon:yes gene_type:complete
MNLTAIKKDLTFYGIINISLYIFGSFLLLPLLQVYFKTNISLLNYSVWYIWSIAYTIYVLYVLNIDAEERNTIQNITYNWFIKGGYVSYQNVFLLSEKEPLYEYAILCILILIPVASQLSLKRKGEVILLKVALFHITASLLLMDWSHLVVNYEFRKLQSTIDQ